MKFSYTFLRGGEPPWFTYLNKVYDWFEERLEIQAIADDITSKYIPPRVNVFYRLERITLTCFLVQNFIKRKKKRRKKAAKRVILGIQKANLHNIGPVWHYSCNSANRNVFSDNAYSKNVFIRI